MQIYLDLLVVGMSISHDNKMLNFKGTLTQYFTILALLLQESK